MFSCSVQARVFDLTSEKLASYFVLNMGTSGIEKSVFEKEANSSYTYSKGVTYNTAAEFGLLYATPSINYRFGIDVIKPDLLQGVSAKNGATEVYKLNSETLIYAPKFGVELNLRRSNKDRSFVFGGVGSASLSIKNSYKDSTIAPVGAHSFEMTSTAQMISYGLGQEGHMTDTATYLFEIGYRQLSFATLKYKEAVTTFSGAKTAGQTVTDVDGNKLALNLDGYYLSFGFRIYMY